MNRLRPQDPPRRYRPVSGEILDAVICFAFLVMAVVALLYLAGQLPRLLWGCFMV